MRTLIFGAMIALALISPARAASCDPAAAKALYMAGIAPAPIARGAADPTATAAPATLVDPATRATSLESAAQGFQACASGSVRVPALLAAMRALDAAETFLAHADASRADADALAARKIALILWRDPSIDAASRQAANIEVQSTSRLARRGE